VSALPREEQESHQWESLARALAPLAADLPVGIVLLDAGGAVAAQSARGAVLLSGAAGPAVRGALLEMCDRADETGAPVETTVSDGASGRMRVVVARAENGAHVVVLEPLTERRLAHELRAMRAMMSSLRGAEPAGEALARLLGSMRGLLACNYLRVYERRQAPDRLACIFEDGARLSLPPESLLPRAGLPARSAVARAVTTQAPVFVANLTPPLFPDDAALAELAPRVALALPVSSRGTPLGALLVTADRNLLGDGELRLVLGFCDAVAVLLERARTAELVSQVRDQMARNDQLAGLGRLTAGVVHEINNPLACVLVGVDLMDRIAAELTKDAPAAPVDPAEELAELRHILADCRLNVDRLKELVGAVRGMSRAGARDDIVFEPGRAIRDAVRVFAAASKHRSRVDVDIPPLTPVKGSPSRLGQVIVNLLDNGLYAMNGAGRLVVRASASAGKVRITVADQGRGIPADFQPHVFEPFFTSKPVDEGTGLGLYICRDIVASMGGSIGFDSTPGGTTFWIELPAFRADPDDDEKTQS